MLVLVLGLCALGALLDTQDTSLPVTAAQGHPEAGVHDAPALTPTVEGIMSIYMHYHYIYIHNSSTKKKYVYSCI